MDPDSPDTERVIREGQEAARAKGVQLAILKAASENEIGVAFASAVRLHADALLAGSDPLFASRSNQLVALALRHHIPTIYEWSYFATAGGLISYGASLAGVYRQLGSYTGRILKGAKSSDLPVQQPTTFELVVNLRTAKALGMTVPQSILAGADQVIRT